MMFWINLLLLGLLVAGHTELMVTLINRLHARRIGCGPLRHVRHLHDLAILAFPPALLWFVGISGPAVLHGGSWGALSLGWTVYLAMSGLGLIGLCLSVARWWRYVPPAAQWANHSWSVDVEARLGYRPLGRGPYRLLAAVPGNEIFRIEVSEKRCRPPRLPEEWDGLSVLHLSDLHFTGTVDLPYYEQVVELSQELRPDLVVFTGDLLDDQRLIEWLPGTLGKLTAPLGCWFILGNHDWYLDPEAIRRRMTELGWQDVAGRTVSLEHRGRTLAIGGTELPWMGTHPDFAGVPEDAFRLLLSHTPDNLPWAKDEGVDLMLSGHNHGGQVVLPVFGPIFSPSRYGVKYAGGVFQEGPTLLYVSRGLAGRHPLRWNCPPELTKLVLTSG